MRRWLCTFAIAALVALAPARAAFGAACASPPLSLDEVARRANLAVIADVVAESDDNAGGTGATLRVLATLAGEPPGIVIRIDGLGPAGETCTGGPRLVPGQRYALFLTRNQTTTGGIGYALADGDQGAYALTTRGTIAPPGRPGGSPHLLPLAPAAFAREVGAAAGTDPTRIAAIVDALGLPEAVERAPAAASGGTQRLPAPPRQVTLAIGIGALTLAIVTALLWRPRPRAR
jgi:hypothetical protein